jgi:catechol 2,3-dioxygenase-like lactoylglutathione lyase family enzyme/DNA-binding IscR family transcriptional regulator
MSRTERLLELMIRLRAKPWFTVEEMAREFGVSRRTMLRDLHALSAMGVPLASTSGPHGGYTLVQAQRLVSLSFTVDEVIGIVLSYEAFLQNVREARRCPVAHILFRVAQIDHVEVFVPDRYEAAAWYRSILGFEILPDYEDWAGPGGPLMISSDEGQTMLALFEGEPLGTRDPVGHVRVAFRVDAAGFARFLSRLDAFPVYNHAGRQVTARDVVDHDKAFSIYFCDPYGNRYEITTYDYDAVAHRRPL